MNLAKWVPTAVTVLTIIGSQFSPAITTYIQHHPQAALVYAGLWAIFKNLMPSPVDIGGGGGK